MVIDHLIKKRRLKVAELAEQGQQQQKLLLAEQWLLTQRVTSFLSSAPGLVFSFTVGCVFQLRHHHTTKLLRRIAGLQWLRDLQAKVD
ncbi:MAG: hypothetical protein KJ930_02095 [Gammaproteobacteria bacterium]|jgi:hypothetical protein|nr:hypothetical protein [Gammaproteobacteria bacterium]MBU2178200.1 hypothetical protein [Gammaproteobacteria bacterium]MBU2225593.1 hypothetical protein [Gammaproteobacteria bacterium]MBU2280384.1 hypothetical protein [Gammaproteobacteria bacterium]MBU2425922.1 hypothetical protein [Gammaproteobacteria bacterium]